MYSWTSLLTELKFTKKQNEVVKRYLNNPRGQGFLPIVEILRSNGYPEEAFELLSWGVKKYPKYIAARVLLAKELYDKGLVQDAFQTLQTTRGSIRDNVLGQKILFKSSILCGFEASAKRIYQHLHSSRQLDEEISEISKILNLDGIKGARSFILNQFKRRNIYVVLPVLNSFETEDTQKTSVFNAQLSTLSMDYNFLKDPMLKSFSVVPLSEIFHSRDEPQPFEGAVNHTKLDSVTLAEIYKKQGHFEKSLEIFQRLLKHSPNNECYKRNIVELAKNLEEQRNKDLTIDPSIALQMNPANNISKSVNFYENLLNRLNHEHDKSSAL